MGIIISRRAALKGTAASLAASLSVGWPLARAEDEIETHGLSAFGDLALPPDFKSLAYVNPNAPKGGTVKYERINEVMNERGERMNAKVRDAQIQKIPYMLVVGDKEAEANAVAVRLRTNENLGATPLAAFIERITNIIQTKSREL